MNKLASIEDTLVAMMNKTGSSQFQGAGVSPFDKDEEKFTCSGSKPTAAQPLQLTAQQFAVNRYGAMLVNFLTQGHGMEPINSQLATTIPPKAKPALFVHNAFKNSFHYDEASRTISIRMERIEDVGKLSLLVCHVVAHIKVQEWSDLNAKFVKAFYESLNMALGELFFSRVRKNELSYDGSHSGQAGTTAAELRAAFKSAKGIQDKTDVMDEFINLHQVSSSQDTLFAPSSLFKRLSQYRQFALTRLQKRLVGIEEMTQQNRRNKATKVAREVMGLREQVDQIQEEEDVVHKKLLETMKELNALHKLTEDQRAMPETKSKVEKLKEHKFVLTARLTHLDTKLAEKMQKLANKKK